MNFDTSVLDELDDFDENSKNRKSVVEEDDDAEEIDFDTSVLDEFDDFDENSKNRKSVLDREENLSSNLASSSMPKKTSTRKSLNSDSSIGFRNKTVEEDTSTIGFRNRKQVEPDSTIGFERKSTKKVKNTEDNFKSEDFLSQMEETLKSTTTVKKRKKSE